MEVMAVEVVGFFQSALDCSVTARALLGAPDSSSKQKNELLTKRSETAIVLETALFAIIWRTAFWFQGVSRRIVPAGTYESQRSRGKGPC